MISARIIEIFRFDLGAKLLVAIIAGGAVGFERELRGKPAGLRTNILICLGSALLMDLSVRIADDYNGDPGRIAAQVVTGIGFLGAGTILHTRGTITGLTSAATIWVVAAIGLTAGAGLRVRSARDHHHRDVRIAWARLVRGAVLPARARQSRWRAGWGMERAVRGASGERLTPARSREGVAARSPARGRVGAAPRIPNHDGRASPHAR
jgi:hypothetical protein